MRQGRAGRPLGTQQGGLIHWGGRSPQTWGDSPSEVLAPRDQVSPVQVELCSLQRCAAVLRPCPVTAGHRARGSADVISEMRS